MIFSDWFNGTDFRDMTQREALQAAYAEGVGHAHDTWSKTPEAAATRAKAHEAFAILEARGFTHGPMGWRESAPGPPRVLFVNPHAATFEVWDMVRSYGAERFADLDNSMRIDRIVSYLNGAKP